MRVDVDENLDSGANCDTVGCESDGSGSVGGWESIVRSRGKRYAGAALCVAAVVASLLACSVSPLRLPWSHSPHYAVSRIATPDALLAVDGSTAPASAWRKNRHGAPYKRTIDVQLPFDASCVPSTAVAHAHKTGSRWMDLDLEFKSAEGKACDGKKTKWTWWRVSVEGVGDSSSIQTDHDGLLPLDDATSVTASWEGWPSVRIGPLPQWKTQMDKLD